MLGQWLSDIFSNKPHGLMKKQIQSHYTSIFRELLLGGILFLLVSLLIFQPIFQQHKAYYLWLAGFAATLGMSFILAIVSTQINGYRRYKDTLLAFATGMMFLLCGVLAISGLFHL
jgi:hypothetical protein